MHGVAVLAVGSLLGGLVLLSTLFFWNGPASRRASQLITVGVLYTAIVFVPSVITLGFRGALVRVLPSYAMTVPSL